MAIFGIGAFFDGRTDVSEDFLRQGIACVGWSQVEAPPLHKLLRRIRTGDIIYIKAHPPGRDLTVKAVGIVTDDTINNYDLGRAEPCRGVSVRWIWHGNPEVMHEGDDEINNVRSNTLYEEMSPRVQAAVLSLLFSRIRA